MSNFGIVALLGTMEDGTSDEITTEVDSLYEVSQKLLELDAAAPQWKLITIVHIEDFPRIMQGATQTDG